MKHHSLARRLVICIGSIVLLGSTASADPGPGVVAVTPITVKELKRMDAGQLEQLFALGKVNGLPIGKTHGDVLLRTDAKLPRVRAKMSGVVWKGKNFDANGGVINQWVGFEAVATTAGIGTSVYDGQPCIVIEYPAGTKVFGNARDELREIGPGLYLGRFYERCPCMKLQGYFVLEMKSCGCGK